MHRGLLGDRLERHVVQYRMLAVLLGVWPVLLGVWPVLLGVWLGRFVGHWFARFFLPITSANKRVQRQSTAGATPKRLPQFHCRLSAMSTHGRLNSRRRRGMRPAMLSSRVTHLLYLLVRSTWCKSYGARCLLCAACCAQRQGYSSRSWLVDRGLLVTQQSRLHRVESAT